jgi:chromosome partitioning protein
MLMKTVTFMNEKGGVGKTTMATTLAAGLAIAGYKVMLIDADPQGHAGLALGVPKSPAFHDLIVRGAAWEDMVTEVAPERYQLPDNASDVKGNLFLVPSNIETNSMFEDTEGDPFAILSFTTQLDGVVDFIIFDTSPTADKLHTTIHMATDDVIYPSHLAFLSLDGLNESFKRLDKANRIRKGDGLPPVRLAGIVPTMTRLNTIEHSESFAQVIEAYGKDKVYRPIAQRTAWEQASRAQKAIFAYDPFDPAAKNAADFVNQFLEAEGAKTRV